MDDIVRKDIPPETPNDRLTTPHLPARDPKDQVEQPDTRGRALTHAQHQSHGGQPNSPRHHQQSVHPGLTRRASAADTPGAYPSSMSA